MQQQQRCPRLQGTHNVLGQKPLHSICLSPQSGKPVKFVPVGNFNPLTAKAHCTPVQVDGAGNVLVKIKELPFLSSSAGPFCRQSERSSAERAARTLSASTCKKGHQFTSTFLTSFLPCDKFRSSYWARLQKLQEQHKPLLPESEVFFMCPNILMFMCRL